MMVKSNVGNFNLTIHRIPSVHNVTGEKCFIKLDKLKNPHLLPSVAILRCILEPIRLSWEWETSEYCSELWRWRNFHKQRPASPCTCTISLMWAPVVCQAEWHCCDVLEWHDEEPVAVEQVLHITKQPASFIFITHRCYSDSPQA